MPIAFFKESFARWFHPRKLLIVSDHKVKQVSIGVGIQVCVVLLLVGGMFWSSYATGKFIAARSTMKEQSVALRSITNTKVGNVFGSLFPASQLPKDIALDAPVSFSALSASRNDPMFARVAMLEQKVHELKSANEMIVERVRATTGGHIESFESIIRQTGLDPAELKKQAEKNVKSKDKAEGGPFVPANFSILPSGSSAMFNTLDELAVLRHIVSNLPLAMPIKNADEQSQFGRRIDPFNGSLALHAGIDLSGPNGSAIYSAAAGKVVNAGRDGAYGNAVDIDHGFGVVSRYGHLSEITVSEGDVVKKGERIGVQGTTGRTTGPHLHYEVRYHDEPINPKKFLEAGRAISQN